jgi:hypothetical protein
MPLQLSVVLELLRRQLDDGLSPVESLEEDHLYIILAQKYLSGHIDSLCAMRSTQDLSMGDALGQSLLGMDSCHCVRHLLLRVSTSLASVRSPGERTWN